MVRNLKFVYLKAKDIFLGDTVCFHFSLISIRAGTFAYLFIYPKRFEQYLLQSKYEILIVQTLNEILDTNFTFNSCLVANQ